MRVKLAASTHSDGTALYTPLVGLSIIVFFIYALQCLPTTVIVRRETGSWKWALAQLAGMTIFAYLASLLVYQIGQILGYS
jgi:ferrous iron transport protein B